jgi:tetratricopeptide (TPR) repeat protein
MRWAGQDVLQGSAGSLRLHFSECLPADLAFARHYSLRFEGHVRKIPSHDMSDKTGEKHIDLDLLTWLEMNKSTLMAGVGVMVVALAGVIIWKHTSDAAHVKASNSILLATLEAPEGAGPSVDVLKSIVNQHSGRPAAEQARFMAAHQQYLRGAYAEARALFEEVGRGPMPDLAQAALLGIAACLDAENKVQEALEAYQRVIRLEDSPMLSMQARLAKARLHESLGQPTEALRLYDGMTDSTASSGAAEARIRRADLLRKHPELAPLPTMTNTVEVVAPTP